MFEPKCGLDEEVTEDCFAFVHVYGLVNDSYVDLIYCIRCLCLLIAIIMININLYWQTFSGQNKMGKCVCAGERCTMSESQTKVIEAWHMLTQVVPVKSVCPFMVYQGEGQQIVCMSYIALRLCVKLMNVLSSFLSGKFEASVSKRYTSFLLCEYFIEQ